MTKLVFFIIVLGFCLTVNRVGAGWFIDDIQELDDLLITATWDVNRPGLLPTTPRGIIQSWCMPLLQMSIRKQDLVDSIFKHNPILLILFRIGELTRINMATKFCNNRRVVSLVANFNRLTNRIIPDIIPWYKITLNTYLAAANPDSEIDAGDLICLMKKSGRHLLAILPPKVQQGLIKYMTILQERQSGLAKIILRHLNVDLNHYSCRIITRPAANPLDIKSHDMALLLAWDRAMRRYSKPGIE